MPTTNHRKIVIIGAGIAGLAACSRLHDYGFDPLIIEARNYCGGRIRIDNSMGPPIGLGANWIHGMHDNPITKLALKNNIEIAHKIPSKAHVFADNQKIIPEEQIQQFNIKFNNLLKRTKEIAFSFSKDVPLLSILSRLVEAENLTPIESNLYKNKLYFLENYMGASGDLLSARYWDEEEIWPGPNGFLINTYQPIINFLEQKCNILKNTKVIEINLRNTDVEIVCEHVKFTADLIIATLPLGVLKNEDVTFNPPLPANKLNAISKLGMGLLNLAVFKFPYVFWPEDSQTIILNEFDNLSITSFSNLYHFIKEPILVGYYGCDRASKLETTAEEEIIDKTLSNLRLHFGSSIPSPCDFLMTRWQNDPYCYGSYSFLKTGSKTSDFDIISEPVAEKIFFAGEATNSNFFATTHGAYLSGIREADRINKLLKN